MPKPMCDGGSTLKNGMNEDKAVLFDRKGSSNNAGKQSSEHIPAKEVEN